MMKRIAIVTGATGGIGERFVKQICLMDDIDEVWAVGRNKDKLDSLCAVSQKVVPILYGVFREDGKRTGKRHLQIKLQRSV